MNSENKYLGNEACSKNKISKLRAIWYTSEGKKIIRTGCYGYLKSEVIN
ncbi:hypothetical protein [Ferroplasma acidiphilum]|nr:hypothetical protein [Ferroplasma acidiphilum]WMT53535.1 MAG: hypothetical protein RE473_01480 [Ferroplasma acidiphilum]